MKQFSRTRAWALKMALGLMVAIPAASQASGSTPDFVVATREHRVTVRQNAVLAFPLYDGQLASAGPGLRDLGTALMDAPLAISVGTHRARSARAHIFQVRGSHGTTGAVTVRLRLASLAEPCVSCRTVHYFYTIK
jgi:hypothetical protein